MLGAAVSDSFKTPYLLFGISADLFYVIFTASLVPFILNPTR
ncbi:hypothetical protein ABID26_004538 [Mesorhizobium shonense]|uniref:Uncharacterized protein n=1 Tax=Mesorhizobium shonense TaxID=1209948 RepID=A0ABV2HX33_9HYPH